MWHGQIRQEGRALGTAILLECAVPGSLRGEPIDRLAIWHGAGRGAWALGQHQPGATKDRSVILLGTLALFPRLALFIVLLKHLDGAGLLAEEVDHERHGEVVQALAPRYLHNHIGADQVVAGIQHANVALAAANVDELERRVSC